MENNRVLLSPSDFRSACARFATGVAVAAVLGRDGEPRGLTVNSFTSVSLEPPLVLVSIDATASIHSDFIEAPSFAVNILAEEDRMLSERFAFHGGDRFDGVEWRLGKWGAPLLNCALAQLECVTRERIQAGDHTIILGLVHDAAWRDGAPLLYFESDYGRLAR